VIAWCDRPLGREYLPPGVAAYSAGTPPVPSPMCNDATCVRSSSTAVPLGRSSWLYDLVRLPLADGEAFRLTRWGRMPHQIALYMYAKLEERRSQTLKLSSKPTGRAVSRIETELVAYEGGEWSSHEKVDT